MKKDNINLNRKIRAIVDEDIYNKEKKVKEIFKFTYNLINKNNKIFKILDIGCSNGSFLNFLKIKFPKAKLYGLDVSRKLLNLAKENIKDGEFIHGSIEDFNILKNYKFDLITMFGVIGILEDPKKSLINSISSLNKGGRLYVSSNFNENNIDVVMKYRRADRNNSKWEDGWNIFSVYTISKILNKIDEVDKFIFYDFNMPFDIAKTNDPMRAWTTRVGNKERYQINGAEQLLNRKILEIHKK